LRTERPRKTKIGTEVAHVTLDSDTTFKVKRSRSPGRFTHRGLNSRGRCSGDHDNVLGVGNYCYVASARRRARCWGAHGGGEGRGHIVSPRAQLVEGVLSFYHFMLTLVSVWRDWVFDLQDRLQWPLAMAWMYSIVQQPVIAFHSLPGVSPRVGLGVHVTNPPLLEGVSGIDGVGVAGSIRFDLFPYINNYRLGLLSTLPHAGSGVVRIDPLHVLAGCRTRRLNQALSVLSLSLGF